MIAEGTAITMSGLLSDAATVLTEITSLATSVITWIVGNPVTLMVFLLGVIGLAIGLVRKFTAF